MQKLAKSFRCFTVSQSLGHAVMPLHFLQIVKIIAPHILILISVGLYILMGGVIFLYLESPVILSSNSTNVTMSDERVTNQHHEIITTVPSHVCTEEELELIFDALYHGCCSASNQPTEECFVILKEELLQCIKQMKTPRPVPSNPDYTAKQTTNEWDYSTAIILSFTIVTTIGYGKFMFFDILKCDSIFDNCTQQRL